MSRTAAAAATPAAPIHRAGVSSQPMPGARAAAADEAVKIASPVTNSFLRPYRSPETQSRALAGALGLGPSTHSDRLLISAAVLSLLAAAAADWPVLCVVDDAQWLDQPSADALVFTARRLQAEQLALLFGAREGESRRFDAVGVGELPLSGLDPPSAAVVLADRTRNAARAVRERLLAEG
jgi:hypothetical protein